MISARPSSSATRLRRAGSVSRSHAARSVCDGIGLEHERLRGAQLAQHLGAHGLRRPLLQRPGQQGHSAVGRSARARRAGRLAQQLHRPWLAARLGAQQVGGGDVGRAGDEACGAQMVAGPPGGAEVVVDRLAHDRMAEAGQRTGPRMSAAASRSAADGASSGSIPAIPAAIRSGTPSPSTATAPASAIASGPSAAIRPSTARATLSTPSRDRRSADASSAATASASRASSSADRYKGLPAVTRAQPAQKASVASGRRSSTHSATARALSARGVSRWATSRSASSAPGSAGGAPVRAATMSAAGSSSSRADR